MNNLQEYKNFCRLLARKSGEIIRQYFRSELKVEIKKDESPVTMADRKAEEVMRESIIKEFPDHGILGEEFGDHNKNAEFKWVLDPIDGTKSYISGAVTFGTLIALLRNGEPILGVINQPVLNEYLVGDNDVTELNGTKVQVRENKDLKDAVLLTTDHLAVHKFRDGDKFEKLIRMVRIYRQWGDCYGYYLLATGYADIMIDPIMSAWDSMALIPIIRGAGGVITDYYGGDPAKGNSIIAACSGLHSEVVKMLN
ncbi:MAG: histidinol-phosphatase [Ignavibacteria bacterium RBG_13_36_8]|nr:MAG: histidinol-phosphatase [Ignavibacteria bacterium RBG_13_36_8]